jgi:glutamyl-tRNA synthetase
MMSQKNHYRVRFAPSPTGHVHLGSARTALYDYLIAKQTEGQFILRIEDTDRKRLVAGAEEELMKSMRWLGIDWDEGPDKGGPYGPYRQSDRKEIYLEYARELIDQGKAYYCFCSSERLSKIRQENMKNKQLPHYDGFCRHLSKAEAEERVKNGEPHVIRFKSPKEGTTVVHDLLRGDIVFDNANLDDFILVKSDGWALYHLAAIVDDYLMKITHVIRGSEWLPTSPLHSLIWQAFGWEEPVWVHLSVFLKPSGKGKMSKREAADLSNNGYSIFIKDLDDFGYLPEAVINWVALMGWSYDDHTEFFTLEDLVEKFSLKKLNPSPAAINFSKLDYFNKQHIKALDDADLGARFIPFFEKAGYKVTEKEMEAIAPMLKDRITTLDDSVDMCAFLFKDKIVHSPESLAIKGKSSQEMHEIGEGALEIIRNISDWSIDTIDRELTVYMNALELTPKELFSFLREAVSGQRVTPPLFDCMYVLGKERSIQRIEESLKII